MVSSAKIVPPMRLLTVQVGVKFVTVTKQDLQVIPAPTQSENAHVKLDMVALNARMVCK